MKHLLLAALILLLTAPTVAPAEPADAPAAPPADVLRLAEGYEIVFDTAETPELQAWVDERLKPVCEAWYPKIVQLLPSDGYEPPQRFTITFHRDMQGVAHASGTGIHCAAKWFADNLEGEAAGAVVHEMVHIVQQYPHRRERPNPSWLVEGVADYIRWFLYEPESQRPTPDPERAKHTDSYRTTGHFLDWVIRHHDKRIVQKLNAAMRRGAYREELWRETTGMSLAALGRAWKATLATDTRE